jgi:N-formylglutamate deformylase
VPEPFAAAVKTVLKWPQEEEDPADRMRAAADPELCVLKAAATAIPVLANLPHSGLHVPAAMQAQLTAAARAFLPNQDWHLDELYDFLPELGISSLQATHSRYVVDLNRAPKPPHFGSFWRAVMAERSAFDVPLYAQRPSDADIAARLRSCYEPYHAQLDAQLEALAERFGRVTLLDLHSFAGPIADDVCLGNGNGSTCSEATLEAVASAFAAEEFGVVRNKVFNGGHITRRCGALPAVEALQIELRYSVYLEPDALEVERVPPWDTPRFAAVKARMRRVFERIAAALG